jgi:CRISPR-associated protein Csx14
MSFSVNVDPTNPGQFFACCGLLELADRLWPGAEGWFADGRFHVTCAGELSEVLSALVGAVPEQVTRLDNGLEVKPLLAPLRFSLGAGNIQFVLDTWMAIGVEKGVVVTRANPPWNFWSGQQTPLRIWGPLQGAIAEMLPRLDPLHPGRLFEHRQFLTGRFGFDPGPAWNALDAGFSPNEQGIAVESSPAVELLAAVGLQRFRPRMFAGRDTFTYATWGVPLPPSAAAPAAGVAVRFDPSVRYRGRVVARGQYAALGYSSILPGESDE